MKVYSNSFTFDIFIARCLGGQFLTGHSVLLFRSDLKLGHLQKMPNNFANVFDCQNF